MREHRTKKCWELDALAPDVIVGLIRTELNSLIDRSRWNASLRKQEQNRELIQSAANKVKSGLGRKVRRR